MVFTHKHIINSPDDLVVEYLKGLCTYNPHVALDAVHKVIYQNNQDRNKVALVCGGGSGHEPAHAGYVGNGMLTAAVCGNIFASPNASQVKHAIELVDNEKGTLIVVKNYTGDVLCFGLSKEQYLATHPEKQEKVKFLIVGDDVAVGRTQGHIVGRRGLAGTVLVYKIAGALANRGASLHEVYETAEWISSRLATVGCGLDHCHVSLALHDLPHEYDSNRMQVPGTAHGESSIKDNEIEIGLGIHNEPGFSTLSPVPSLKELMEQLTELLTSTSDQDRSFLPFAGDGGDEVVLMVNNLGGMSELEIGSIAREALSAMTTRRIQVRRLLVGTFMTSLNMPGFSLTVLLLPRLSEHSDNRSISISQVLDLLDAKVDVPGWKWCSTETPAINPATVQDTLASDPIQANSGAPAAEPKRFEKCLQVACEALVRGEPDITRMDTVAGDGDCGLTLKAGAEAVLQELRSGNITGNNVVQSIVRISKVGEEKMGGTSGALYSIFFSAMAQGLAKLPPSAVVDSNAWITVVVSSLASLYTYTRARPPSRTLIDPLAAFVECLRTGGSLQDSVKRGVAAAEQTAQMEAKAGRSAYVEGKHLKGVADPGAWGVKLILEALVAE